jgi:RNA polymerase sigma-70 factor (ECF subfamily)
MSFETRSYKSEKARFGTTCWSAVLRAAQSDHPQRQEALEALCRTYWYPIYAFIRRRGVVATDAQDCTQEFFQSLVSGSLLKDVSEDKGRFRSYLMACCQHFLLNMWEKQRAQKRGGQVQVLSLDAELEERFLESPSGQSPEVSFDREWAQEILWQVQESLESEYRAAGKQNIWQALHPHLSEAGEVPTATLAASLNVSENHLHVLMHRLRQRYRDILRREVSATIDNPADLKDEIRYLLTQLE